MTAKILFVDDEPDLEPLICQKFRKKLRTEEFQLFFAHNGQEALEKLQEQPDLDMVLTDINMPVMDGLTLLAKLNDINPIIKTVVLSAYGDMKNIRKAMNCGAFDFLTKPIDFQDLEITINKTLNHVQQLKENLRSRQEQEEELRRSEAKAREQAIELEKALRTLQQTQGQLIQTEKMSSLGQLVAGVAHEINNPVNFIFGNLDHAGGYTQDLVDLIDLYQEYYPNPAPEIKERLKDIELEFLIEDLPKLLSSMKIGAERIRQIVLTLRCFSRLDEAEMKPVNIHEGIDSTLVILHHRLKAKGEYPAIQVIKEYADLPFVECYAGQLNQVFMNLIVNALDALESLRNSPVSTLEGSNIQTFPRSNPTIWIHTEILDCNSVKISIKDNGPGMTDSVKARIFNPFFTTKSLGQGTGLGLSISYQIIVDKHGGRIECVSKPGQGTEFSIEIPIKQNTQVVQKVS